MTDTLSGRCFCGAVKWFASVPMLWASICHCKDCQRAASADYVSWFEVRKDAVAWEGPRKCYQSSSNALRSFCEACGSPLSYETYAYPDETHLYAVMLDDLSVYHPASHIFWAERVPWIEVFDDLPKHSKGSPEASSNG